MEQQLDVLRETIQKKIPDKKVRTVWFLSVDFQNNILYSVSGNNSKLFAVAKISPVGDVEIMR